MARGQHDLDLSDQKMFNFLLQKSYSKLTDRPIHEIPVSDVLNFLKHTSVARLEGSLRKLKNTTIDIDYQEDGKEHSVSCHILSFDVSKAEDGILTYAFDPILLRFLYEPKIYARINMHFFSQFRTSYGAKLFEIMTFFQHRHHRTWSVSIAELKRSLGVADDQYPRFDNLKRSVIEKAISEVNALSPFGIKAEYIKGGRGGKVVEVRISVIPRSELEPQSAEKSASSLSKSKRDPDTIDLLDGQTDIEREEQLTISEETLEEGRQLLIKSGRNPEEIETKIDQWRDALSGETVSDPNLNFLRWLSIHLEKEEDDTLSILDNDVLGTLLADFE